MAGLDIGVLPGLGALIVFSLGLTLAALRRDRPLVWRFAPPVQPARGGPPVFETLYDYVMPVGQAHAPAILLDHDGFSVCWFQGSKEAQPDVDIHGVGFLPDGEGWRQGDAEQVLTRAALGAALEPRQLVVTLGNVTQNDAIPGAVFATLASLGGWAAASIADVRMDDARVSAARRLNLSPLLNRSHLVKAPMVAYEDGSHGLPAYFEMGRAHGELVRLDRDGWVRDKRRMGGGRRTIQPMIVPLDGDNAVALMRNFGPGTRRLVLRRTGDGGRSWSAPLECGLPNPNAPVAALPLGGGRLMMVFNDDERRNDVLRIALSDDAGASWRRIHTLEDGGGDAQAACRYPVMRVVPGGDIVLAYSFANKRGIRVHRFNRAWVEAQ